MKCLSALFILLILLVGCGNQPETDPAINIPADEVRGSAPDLTAGIDRANQEVCRANMQTAASSIAMYFAQNGELPATLEEATGVPMFCPDGGEYTFTAEDGSWRVECPGEPSHGAVEDGIPIW